MTTDIFEHIDPEELIITEDNVADEALDIIEINCCVHDVFEKFMSDSFNFIVANKLRFSRFFDRRHLIDFETYHDNIIRFNKKRITTLDAVRILAAIRKDSGTEGNGFYIDIHPEIKLDNDIEGGVTIVTLTHNYNDNANISGHQAAAIASAVEMLERKPTSFEFRFHLVLRHFNLFLKGIQEICHIALKENLSLMYPIAGKDESIRQSAYSLHICGYKITEEFAKHIGVVISYATQSEPYGDRMNIMSMPSANVIGREIKELLICTNYEDIYFRYVYFLGDYYDASEDKTYYMIGYDYQPFHKTTNCYEEFDTFLDLKSFLENENRRCI